MIRSSRRSRAERSRRSACLPGILLAISLAGGPASLHAGDQWLVYIGGGLEPIEGGWSERQGRVVFEKVGGTLVSVPFEDVDLPTSTFISWQLDGRRRVPPRVSVPEPADESPPTPPCVEARLKRVLGGESLEVESGDAREIVHVACLDTPESGHKYSSLSWFGRAAASAAEIEARPGAEICLTEQAPSQRDGEGHRIVFVKLPDGRDFATVMISGGFGLLRPTECRHGAHYRAAEDFAIGGQRGLWGRSSAEAAFQAARVAVAGGPPGRRASGGCRLRR